MKKLFFLAVTLFLNAGLAHVQTQPRLKSPVNDAVIETTTPALYWDKIEDVNVYVVNIFADKAGRNEVIKLTIKGNSCSVPKGYLIIGGQYYWRVTPRKNNILRKPSQMWSFTILQTEDTGQETTQAAQLEMATSNPSINSPEGTVRGYPAESKAKKYNEDKKRRRVLGDHIFPTTVLFPSPIPSARFGFSQGVLKLDGEYTSIENDKASKNKYNYAGFSEVFDSGIIFSNYAALDLNAQIQLSGGMEESDFITIEVKPQGDLRVGPVFYYKSEKDLSLSFSPRLYYSKGIKVSAAYGIDGMINVLLEKLSNDSGFWSFYEQTAGEDWKINGMEEWFTLIGSTYTQKYMGYAIKGFSQNIMVNTSKIAIAPYLRVFKISPRPSLQKSGGAL
ncbi:MAG: hypothetical protein HY796_07300 [Elusimicrobia bacterium]|nr:hypothetical protein [Elusimicrobiota bacterium]